MNELIKILQNHEDKYFYGEEKSLTPFVSGEFLEKFKEAIFANKAHRNPIGFRRWVPVFT